jgi:hypothetical protein
MGIDSYFSSMEVDQDQDHAALISVESRHGLADDGAVAASSVSHLHRMAWDV